MSSLLNQALYVISAYCRELAPAVSLSSADIETVNHVETLIGYHFENQHHLLEALMLLPSSHTQTKKPPNQRIAVVGDAALDLALSQDWFLCGDMTPGS